MSSTPPRRRRRTLTMGSYILGWLRPTELVYPSSRPSLYLIVPWRFRFVPTSAWPRLGGAVDAGSCHAGSLPWDGDTLGARSGPRRNRSGVLKARVIVLPPWDSPASWASPEGLGGVAGTITSLSLLSGLSSGCLLATLLPFSALSAAISAASAPVNDLAEALP